MEAILFASRRVRHILQRRPNGLRFARHLVAANHVAILRLGVDDARVFQIGNRHEPIAAKHLEPVVVEDSVVHARRARAAPIVVVLHAATDVVRPLHVEADVIEQADRNRRNEGPRMAHVVRDRHAAIVTDQHVVGIARVDPDSMNVVVRHQRGIRLEVLSAIDRHMKADATHVDAIGVSRIDAHLTEVHRARIDRIHLLPRRAAVIRAIHTGGADRRIGTARGCRRCALVRRRGAASATRDRGPFDCDIRDVGVAPIHINRNATKRAAGKSAVADARPRIAAIGRLPQSAARSTAIHAAGGATPLIHRREEDVGITRRLREVIRAGVFVAREDELPRRAAIGGLIEPPFSARTEERAGRRNDDDIVIARIDENAIDVLRVGQSHQREGLAAVGRLVDTTAPRGALTIVRLTSADPDEIGVVLRDGDVADRDQSLILKERREKGAVARGLPQASVRGSDVPDGRIRFIHGDVGDTSRHRRGADRPEVEFLELRRDGSRGGALGQCRAEHRE